MSDVFTTEEITGRIVRIKTPHAHRTRHVRILAEDGQSYVMFFAPRSWQVGNDDRVLFKISVRPAV